MEYLFYIEIIFIYYIGFKQFLIYIHIFRNICDVYNKYSITFKIFLYIMYCLLKHYIN